MTIKRRHAGGIEISYHRGDDNISCLVEEDDSIFNSHNVPIYSAIIPPVSINKYRLVFQYLCYELVDMQKLS